MASRKARGGRVAKAAAGRQTRSKKVAVPVAEVEVVEERGGLGIDTGIAIITGILLLAAILFADAHLGRYDAGMFF